jgi:hypothetical protein
MTENGTVKLIVTALATALISAGGVGVGKDFVAPPEDDASRLWIRQLVKEVDALERRIEELERN